MKFKFTIFTKIKFIKITDVNKFPDFIELF